MKHGLHKPYAHQQGRVVLGVFLILAGILALLSNILHLNIGNAWDYWPMLFCLLGIQKIVRRPGVKGGITGLALLVLGAGWTLQNLGIIHHAMPLILATLLILAGLGLILRSLGGTQEPCSPGRRFSQRQEHNDRVMVEASMSGAAVNCDAQDFKGGELRAVLGGIKLDLRRARLTATAELHVYAMCGGIEIRIPQDWSLSIQVSPLLGGVEDKTIPPSLPTGTLVLNGEAIMGGIEIRN